MIPVTFLGDFPQVAFTLACGFALALGIAFVILRAILGWMGGQQYNVTDATQPAHALGLPAPAANPRAADPRRSGATGVAHLLPAAAPSNRFRRIREFAGLAGMARGAGGATQEVGSHSRVAG